MAASDAQQQANRAEIDPRRLVVIALLSFTLVLGFFFGHLLNLAFANLGVAPPSNILSLGIGLGDVLGFVLAIGLAVYAWVDPRVHGLSMEVATELMRVTWPSWDETRISTLAVVGASMVASVVLFGIDTLAYHLMVDWLPALWGKL